MSNLPVPVNQLPEALRVYYAMSDLSTIADQAQKQVAVHEQAIRAADEVLHTVSAMEVPNREALARLGEQYLTDSDADEPKQTASGFARQIVRPKESRVGVTEKDVMRDVLSRLHPDRQFEVPDADAEGIFKAITDAQQNNDQTLVQGLYAGSIAARAVGAEAPNAASLEKARYKAWLALQASKGRFETGEEVDAWRERELALAPHRVRAGLLSTTVSLFARSLGATEEGSITLPDECFLAVSQGFDAAKRVIERIMGDKASSDDFSDTNLGPFDSQLTSLIGRLGDLLSMQAKPGMDWSYRQSVVASEIGDALYATARELESYRKPILPRKLGSIALMSFR